ncbi:MAG: hypothetical protein ACLQEQ_00640 [Nitrososphaerales archaeon]
MKLWVPAALGAIVVFAYVFLYYLSTTGNEGGNSVGLVNTVGLASVVIGVVAAGLILRRAAPHS